MPALIEARDLVKHYPGVRAVDGVSFKVDTGTCFGLLGPNGAGKTTTLEMLEGINQPTSGEIRFRGEPLGERFRQQVGIQFQSTALQDFQTVREALALFAALYESHTDLTHLSELCHLQEFLDRDTRKLSGGQRQRLLLAIALVNDPALVFLDEPTTGLDPQSRRNFWALIEDIKQAGKTIVLTTHYMEEAHRLCDEIAIVDRGRILVHGTPQALLNAHFASAVIRVKAELEEPELPSALEVRAEGGGLSIYTDDISACIDELQAAGADLSQLQVGTPTLEDLFIDLTGHSLRS